MSRTRKDENEIELESVTQTPQSKAAQNQGISAGVTVAEGLSLATVYTTFLRPVLKTFMEELGKYFLFPLLALGSVVQAILAWRQASLEKWKSRTIAHAVIETIAAAAIVTAVVGALAASTMFAIATPLIFVAVGAVKTVYNGGAAIYNDIKANDVLNKARVNTPDELKRSDPIKYKKYEQRHARAVNHGIAAVANLFGAVISAVVFVVGKTAVAIAGVIFGLGVAGLGIYHAIKAYKAYKAPQDEATKPLLDDEPRNDIQPSPDQSPTLEHRKIVINTASIQGALLHSSQGNIGSPTMSQQAEVTPLAGASDMAIKTAIDGKLEVSQTVSETPKEQVVDQQEGLQQDDRRGYAMGYY